MAMPTGTAPPLQLFVHFTDLVGGDNALSTVKLLLEHNADVNATVERAKDEPLDSCDGSR